MSLSGFAECHPGFFYYPLAHLQSMCVLQTLFSIINFKQYDWVTQLSLNGLLETIQGRLECREAKEEVEKNVVGHYFVDAFKSKVAIWNTISTLVGK